MNYYATLPEPPAWDNAATDAAHQANDVCERFNAALNNRTLKHKFVSASLMDAESGRWLITLEAPPEGGLDSRTEPEDWLNPLWQCLMAIGCYGDAPEKVEAKQ